MPGSLIDKLPQGYTEAVGTLVLTVTELESILTDLLAIFMRTDIVGAVIALHHQQFSSKIDTLLALARARFEDDAQYNPILDLIKKARSVGEYRNSLIHAHWAVRGTGEVHSVRFTARGKFARSKTLRPLSEIHERTCEAREILARLESLRSPLSGKIASPPLQLCPQDQ